MTNPQNKLKQYYQTLQIELTDTRKLNGKKHELAFVVTCFIAAILKRSDLLNFSRIHRTMEMIHDECASVTESKSEKCISRTQLGRVLENIDLIAFNDITERIFQIPAPADFNNWRAIDGKELRGSINGACGEKRGESAVVETAHGSKESSLIGFYSATKESEKNVVYAYLSGQENLEGKCFSLDALHNSEKLLSEIERKKGIYLVQIKTNQELLLEDLEHIKENLKPSKMIETIEKDHGRIDTRKGTFFPINVECLEPRWSKSGIRTLLCMKRCRENIKTGKVSEEISYYVLNMEHHSNEQEIFNAVRNHWTVEVNNRIRDVNFGEDYIKCSKPSLLRFIASALTFALNVVIKANYFNNIKVTRENMTYKPVGDETFFAW